MKERELWQAVLEQAINDACYEGDKQETLREGVVADRWIRRNTRDFQQVCTLAGMDPDFIREAYMAGKLAGYAKTKRGKQDEHV